MLLKKKKATHKATRQGPFSVGSPKVELLSLSGHASRDREPKRKSWDSGSSVVAVPLGTGTTWKKNRGEPKNFKKNETDEMGRQPQRTAERLGAARSPAGEAAAEKKANAEVTVGHATVKGSKRSRASTAVKIANTAKKQAKRPAATVAAQVRRVFCATRLPRRVGFRSSGLHRPSLRTRAGIDAASRTVCDHTGRDAAQLEQSPAMLRILVARRSASSKSSGLRYRPDSRTVLKA